MVKREASIAECTVFICGLSWHAPLLTMGNARVWVNFLIDTED